MQIRKIFAGVAVAFMVTAALVGCGNQQPQKPADEVVKDGVKKLSEVTAASYSVALKGDIKDPASTDVNFDIKLTGSSDMKDIKDPKLTMKLSGTASDKSNNGGSGDVELRLNKDAVYFIVNSLNMKEVPAEASAMFKKWWKVAIPAGMLDELKSSMAASGSTQALTPEQIKMRDMIINANLFGKPTLVGTENVGGEQSSHFTASIDKAALLNLVKSIAAEQGNTISDSELAEAQKSFARMTVTADLWVGQQSGILNKVTGQIKVTGSDKEASGNISFEASLSDINKSVNIEVPAGATEFPISQFLGGMTGASLE